MNKYQETYFSSLPSDLIKELDKYQDFVNKNDEFEKMANNAVKRLNTYLYNYNEVSTVTALINNINKFLQKYEITSKFQIVRYPTRNGVKFISNGYQNLTNDILKEVRLKLISSTTNLL